LSFNVGVTNVTYKVTNPDGLSATCSFKVTIISVNTPNIAIGGCTDVTDTAGAGSCTKTPGTFSTLTYSDACWPTASLVLTYTLTGATTGSGTGLVSSLSFNVGVTTVTYKVTNPDGLSATCSFNVTILSVTPPAFTSGCPANITQPADAGMCNANVTVPVPAVTDPCSLGYTVTNSFNGTNNASGTYPIGTTSVTWTITPTAGAATTCVQTITVTDLLPTLSCPASFTVQADFNQSYASNVTVPAPAYGDNCPGLTLTWVMTGATTGSSPLVGENKVPTPNTFNVGTTTITYTLVDSNAHNLTCSFNIIVESKPVVTCPVDIARNTDAGLCSAAITIIPATATGSGVTITGVRSDGKPLTDPFPVGLTTITWTATNISGSDVCTQKVTVTDLEPPTFTVPSDLEFCVNDIQSAIYNATPTDPNYDDLTTPRPDYYRFTPPSSVFNLDAVVNNFNDNCCAVGSLVIHWRIDFTAVPSQAPPHAPFIKPAIPDQTGQPSAYLLGNIDFPGDGVNFTNVIHKIYYRLVDCNGNSSTEKFVNIIIKPRPNVIKVP
jgi:hypothetical protein